MGRGTITLFALALTAGAAFFPTLAIWVLSAGTRGNTGVAGSTIIGIATAFGLLGLICLCFAVGTWHALSRSASQPKDRTQARPS